MNRVQVGVKLHLKLDMHMLAETYPRLSLCLDGIVDKWHLCISSRLEAYEQFKEAEALERMWCKHQTVAEEMVDEVHDRNCRKCFGSTYVTRQTTQ